MSTRFADPRYQLALKITSLSKGPEQSLASFETFLGKYASDNLKFNTLLDPKNIPWLRAVDRFLNKKISTPKTNSTRRGSLTSSEPEADLVDDLNVGNDNSLTGRLIRKTSVNKLTNDIIDNEIILETPPPNRNLDPAQFEIEFNENHSFNPELALTEAHQSIGWLTNNLFRTPTSTVRLNPIERRHFLTKLSLLKRSSDSVDQQIALIMSLMYGLGLGLREANALTVGKDQQIDLNNSTYLKHFNTPPECYIPSDENKPLYEKSLNALSLPIHPFLQQQLQHLRVTEKIIFDSIDSNLEDQKELIKQHLSDWRENGHYRITYQRISSALSAEINVLNQNPLITFLLSGTKSHASPTMQYYQSVSIKKLIQYWQTTSNALFD